MENGNETHRNENRRERNPDVTQPSEHTEMGTVEGSKKHSQMEPQCSWNTLMSVLF